MKKRQTTTFYIETLVLIAIFIVVILILTRVFGMGNAQSRQAGVLTGAVTLARNAAEAVSASHDPESTAELLNENGNSEYAEEGITARYDADLRPDPSGIFCVNISWDPEEREAGELVNSHIEVSYDGRSEPVYTIDTAVFIPDKE